MYEDGVKQRDRINNKFTPTITILTAEFSGGMWLILRVIKIFSNKKIKICLLDKALITILLSITIIFFINAVIDFIFCFLKYEFSYPQPIKVKKIIEENKTYLDKYSEEEILDNIIQNITDSYRKMAIDNIKETNERCKYLNKSYTKIVWTLGLLLIDLVLILCL